MTAKKSEGSGFAALTAGAMMSRNMVTVPLDATAREIERVLIENDISGVPVRDHSERIVGILSWRDVMEYFAQSPENEPHRPHAFYRIVDEETLEEDDALELPIDDGVTARDMMSSDLLTVEETDGLKSIAITMTRHAVHRLLVRDAAGDVVGILSTMDILRALAEA
ncbi:MAG: CBS domain-containing protein [Planctomycetes bacterium]|nr:CBS domain-containing protein [Planctomycetota bacterium]